MTGAVLVAVYLLVLACFLGNDVISKVPPTLYPALLAGMAALSGVGLVAALSATRFESAGGSGALLGAACGLCAAAVTGGLMSARRALGKK